VNQFSPVTKLPLLGIVGVLSHVFLMVGLKAVTVTDYLVITSLDCEMAALFSTMIFGVDRLSTHFMFAKYYVVHTALVLAYFYTEHRDEVEGLVYPWWAYAGMICLSKALTTLRSLYIKANFAAFNSADPVPNVPETYDALFKTPTPPRKHRFAKFPGPVLLTLDAMFDSGLADNELHGVGPLGTQDLFILTDFTYMLPLISLASWNQEGETLEYGFLPAEYVRVSVVEDAEIATSTGDYARVVTDMHFYIICILILIFMMSYAAQPWATTKYLFNRGSSIHTWRSRPVLIAVLPFFIDVIYLNIEMTKLQMLITMFVGMVYLELRQGLWTRFKRKYLCILTKELHYHMPSTLRGLQKRTLLEFMGQTSTDDYEFLLLETCIYHGNNIRQFTNESGMKVWDPRPSAIAAWKLATSIVMKAIRHEKQAKKKAAMIVTAGTICRRLKFPAYDSNFFTLSFSIISSTFLVTFGTSVFNVLPCFLKLQ